MGCTQSKIDNEEAVARCKERKSFMKEAVANRNAFAAAHAAYTVSLKNTGAALSDYGEAEFHDPLRPSHPSSSSSAAVPSAASIPPSSSAATAVQPPVDAPLPPPPPPLPDFPPAPLQRAASMPDLPLPKPKNKLPADPSILEEDDDFDPDDPEPPAPIDDDRNALHPNPVPPPPPAENSRWDYLFDTDNIPVPSLSQPQEDTMPEPPAAPEIPAEKVVVSEPSRLAPHPKPVKKPKPPHHHQTASAEASVAVSESKRGRMVAAAAAPMVNLLQVLNDLDDHFLKASESAHDVSKMLEATRMHYHSNFADNRGHIDHSARVMRVITWNRSIKGMNNDDGGKDDFDNEDSETHATVLDKMLAWEKKLYDEVKAGELMKIEYQKKVALLNKQKKRGASPETIEKTKEAVSHLHTRYIVDMQSMDSTVSEINRLRDKQLYPKLVDLVDGMAKMWETMHVHHSSQLKIVSDLRNLDISFAPKETSEQHHERTIQLWKILREWHSRFQELITHQKEYIRALNSWLKLNLMPIESSLKENGSSPQRVTQPLIQRLLRAWNDLLPKLPDELARGAIYSFSEVIRTIMIIQEEELKLKEKCEETRREYMRKRHAFEEWHQKYLQKKATAEAAASSEEAAADPESSEAAIQKDLVAERKAVVESLRTRLTDEEESYQRTCRQVREKSVANLRTHLPELFRAMSDFALPCSEMYKKLMSVHAQSQDTTTAN